MERNKPRRRRNRGLERFKTLLIVLLSLSAVYLTGLTLVQNQASPGSQGLLGGLISLFQPQTSGSDSAAGSAGQLTAAARPVRIAVCDGLYYAYETAVAYEGHMDTLVSGYGGNGVPFVFELGEDSGYESLDPYVLISSSTLAPPVYRASNPLSNLDEALVSELQKALSFQTSYYPIPNGIRIREGQETLEISSSGAVSYSTAEGTASRYPVGDEDGYNITELIETTRRMAADTVGRYCSAARIYLMGVEETENGLEVCYGYSLNGAEVSLPGGDCAARFTVQDGQITAFTLQFRRYEDAGQTSLVLREQMAAAALEVLAPEGRELALCYSDTGSDTVQAGWIAK